MDMTVKEVKNKAHNLRTYFVKELAKINFNKPTGTGTDDVERQTSKWPHFESMAFLRDSVLPRKSVSTILARDSDLDENEEIRAISDDDFRINRYSTRDIPPATASTNRPLSSLPKMKKQYREDQLIGKTMDFLDSRSARNRKEDSNDAFGRNVAHQLRDMESDAMREFAKL